MSTNRYTNREPNIGDLGDMAEWIQTMNQYQDVNNNILEVFFRHLFRLLEVNNMCFSSGAFVFENIGNVLFNMLTFNKLLINNNVYYCDEPLSKEAIEPAEGVYIIGTDTHRSYYDKFKNNNVIVVKPRECMPSTRGKIKYVTNKDRSNTRFERVLNPKWKNLCGNCPPTDEDLLEPKGVILYYPFTVKSDSYPTRKVSTTIKQMLYVKFEADSVSEEGLSHALSFASRAIGTKKTYPRYPSLRREDDKDPVKCNYDEMYANKDFEFYRVFCPEDMPVLNWYNETIRTGCEFFVSAGLLKKFFKMFLFTQFNCESARTIEDLDEEKMRDLENTQQGITEDLGKLNIAPNNTGGKKKRKSRHRKNKKTVSRRTRRHRRR